MKPLPNPNLSQVSAMCLAVMLGSILTAVAEGRDVLFRIADDIVDQTLFEVPESDQDPQPTRYNAWMYQNFMLFDGMDALGAVTGEERYKKYTARNIDFFVAFQAKYGDQMTGVPAGNWYSQPRQMWHCGMIAAFPERQRSKPSKEIERGMAIFDGLLEQAPTLADGTLARRKRKGQGIALQIDDLYMIAPYWCRKAALLKEPKWLDRAIDEALSYHKHLWNEDDLLMRCLWLKKTKEPYGLYWGRGNGWYVMAVTDLLTFIPEGHPNRKQVLSNYRDFMNGIVARQGDNGLWHQLLDRPDTYTETSCSGMFTYCILKGVNEGWLDPRYLKAGNLGWRGLLSKVNKDFKIIDVCPPTGIRADPKYYTENRSPITHDQHGIGPFLLAGTAHLRANRTRHHQLAKGSEQPVVHDADVCVYGGTASGVMAAIAARKQGSSVVLVEPSRWLGGMTGGGINELDWGNREAVGGTTLKMLADESGDAASLKTLGAKGDQYGSVTRRGKGNAVYRQRFREIVAAHGIKVVYDHRLGRVQLDGKAIRSISLDHAPVDATGCPIPEPIQRNAVTVTARVFIDCTYEGDLLAKSGVTYTWGRESREQYGESLAGVRPSLWVYDIDPYVEPGNPKSGLIPFVQDIKIGRAGSADKFTMGYCFRFEFDRDGKGIPIPEPQAYDPAEFELYRRAFENGVNIFANRKMRKLGSISRYKEGPRIHTNLSRSLWTNTVYGINADYPDGDWAERARVWKFHQQFLCKQVHFAKTDPSVPAELKRQAEQLGFKRGVFEPTGGWPNQLYVREARRMVSSYVVTQIDLEGQTDPEHSVGLASYGVDDWPYATVVEDGKIALQGGAFSILYVDGGKNNGVYKIPYEAIVPRKGECENLIVPMCLSASHIAMTSIRMEPVWMVLGESAGIAAGMVVKSGTRVQDVPYDSLREKLLAAGQKLEVPRVDIPPREWASQAAWNHDKKGYEWVFVLIDENGDGIVTAEEYKAFQEFKKTHAKWEKALRQRVVEQE